jgi:hypothetical protein
MPARGLHKVRDSGLEISRAGVGDRLMMIDYQQF